VWANCNPATTRFQLLLYINTITTISMAPVTVGVLALQGGVGEHIALLQKAAAHLLSHGEALPERVYFNFIEVRTPEELTRCNALIIPGGESTTMAIVARRLGLFDPLRQFVKYVSTPPFFQTRLKR